MAITIKTNQKIQSIQIKDNIYIYIYMCVCVCVCVRARACVRACNYTNLDDKTFKVSKKIFN